MKTTALKLIASLSLAAALAPAFASAAPSANSEPTQIRQFQYSVDYERIGHHYDVAAVLRGDAKRVSARLGGLVADGRLSRHISVGGQSKLWFFRQHRFVKALRADLEADERAKVAVRAVTDDGTIRAKCKLELKRDPQFGDFAGARCKAA